MMMMMMMMMGSWEKDGNVLGETDTIGGSLKWGYLQSSSALMGFSLMNHLFLGTRTFSMYGNAT